MDDPNTNRAMSELPGDSLQVVGREDGKFFKFPASLKTGLILFDQNQKGGKQKERATMLTTF